ncbi:MAG: rhomboid family intramembrane serine protease [Flavobacteriales bacterium]|nr:rhomboid family intramembrane serine protease [Flavobacteriales bacterium]
MTEQTSLTNIGEKIISDKTRLYNALMVTGVFLGVMWAVFAFDHYLDMPLNRYGLRPRSAEGLIGVITIHFLHSNLQHIWQNTMAFAVLNTMLFFFYRPLSLKVFLYLLVLSPLLMWLWARPDNHIGSSVLVYGIASFLFVSGVVRWDTQLMRVSLFVAMFYGSLVWYLFPIEERISWEGHLSGAIAGAALAWIYRHQGPQRKVYTWENEPDEEEAPVQLPPDNITYTEIPTFTGENRKIDLDK